MAAAINYLILAAIGFFSIFYFTKMGCKGDGANGMLGPDGSLCFPGWEAFGIGGQTDEEQEQEIEEASDRNEIRQVTPPAERGIISKTHTSDPVGSGGGVGGPSKPVPGFGKKSSLAHAFAAGIEDQITIA